MEDFKKLWKYLRFYKKNLVLVFIFNLFGAIFSFGMVAVLIPFLNVLFDNTQAIYTLPETFEFTKECILQTCNYYLTLVIERWDKPTALLLLCAILVNILTYPL